MSVSLQMTGLNLVDKCLHQGLMKLAEALQYYWPGARAMTKGKAQGYLQEIAENNIALQLARSFSDNGFHVWAEVPFAGRTDGQEQRRLDFLAFQYEWQIFVALELKNNLETPQNNIDDFYRLVDLAEPEKGVCDDEQHGINYSEGFINACPNKFYGMVSIMSNQAFADWWRYPQNNNCLPHNRTSEAYAHLGEILAQADRKMVSPLVENFSLANDYRFRRAGYALFSSETLGNIKKKFLESNK